MEDSDGQWAVGSGQLENMAVGVDRELGTIPSLAPEGQGRRMDRGGWERRWEEGELGGGKTSPAGVEAQEMCITNGELNAYWQCHPAQWSQDVAVVCPVA